MATPDPRRKRFLNLQVALDRAGFSPGEIDAKAGPDTDRALRAFQQANGLHVTGELDRRTVRALGPLFWRSVSGYRITEQDVEQSLNYTAIEEMLAERFHTSPALLHYLNPNAGFDEGESLMVPSVEPRRTTPPARRPVVVTVAGRARMLRVQDASGELIFHAPMRSAVDSEADQVESSCLSRVSVEGIRLTSWDAMRLAALMDGNAKVIVR